jgi:hypothetical protein
MSTFTTSVAFAQTHAGQPESVLEPTKIYSPYVERTTADSNLAEGVYWGDTHLHTSYSTDAGMMGNTLGPEDAYRFARGEEVLTSHNMRVRLIRPLDFLVVADHAENLGLAPYIAESHPDLLASEWGRKVHDLVKAGNSRQAFQTWLDDAVTAGTDPIDNPKMSRSVWDRQIDFADKYNEPGEFTALIGFEWTSISTQETPGNLHRVVIFKDGADKAEQVLPFSTFDSIDPEKLWDYMADYEEKTGGSILAIAHNGNVSNGQMFSTERLNGRAINREYQGRRRGTSVAVTQRRVCGLRHVGQVRYRRLQTERRLDVAVRIRSFGPADRHATRAKAGRQSLQIRHDRQHRCPHVARDDPRRKLLRQSGTPRARSRPLGARNHRVAGR